MSIQIERYTLKKEGFPDIKLRNYDGIWEILSYRNPHTGDERWTRCEFSEEVIQEHIKKYCVRE
jgi:hypothetical protein